MELLARQLRLRDDNILANLDVLRVGLRQLHKDAQRVRLREREQRATRAAARVDQIADIDIALRDHARERRHDALEAFELAQPLARPRLDWIWSRCATACASS